MKKHVILSIFIFFFLSVLNAQDILVSNISEFNAALKKASNGGTIILKNGVWKDANLVAKGNGTKDNPIVIKAETAGNVILSGDSSLSISGTYVIVSGLWFKDGNTTQKSVVQFRTSSKDFAYNCRLANSTISYYDTKDPDLKNHWVDIWGKNNRVDHNNFTGKSSPGTTLVVWLKGDENIDNNHQIDHNYFGFRPDLGENGGETIRIGTSDNSMKSSKTVVEYNTFKNCDGEIEIISNKSANNIFRYNLFLESKGALTLRHGNNALVEHNVFLGNNIPNTGGIRVINEGHIIRNNLLIGLKGSGFRGPIVIMNGVPNSPLNRYNQVKDVNIQNNTIINCGPMTFGAGKDDERTLPPIRTVFANNIITNTDAGNILEIDDTIEGISFSGNIVDSEASVNSELFQKAEIDWVMVGSLPIPSENNTVLTSVSKLKNSPSVDITNLERTTYASGAFNLGSTRIPRAISMITGPGWKPDIKKPVVKPTEQLIKPAIGAIRKAISSAPSGSIIKLEPGVYEIEKKIKIGKTITIQGAKDGQTILKMKDNTESTFDYFFRADPGAKIYLNDIEFLGDNGYDMKYAIVSPDENESGLYSIYVNNCSFKNFTNTNGGSIFKAYKGTKADTLSFINSKFKDSYRGLNLSYEKDLGMYSANVIFVKNSVFDNIEQFAINYTRNIPNVNLEGGELVVDHCVFNKVANTEKGRIIKNNGIHKVSILNSAFLYSYKAETPIVLSGIENTIKNCLIFDSGNIKVNKGAQEYDIINKNPKWEDKDAFIPSEKSPLLKANNGIETIGLKLE
jgi:poly(beta-D-mannuronate) lyase